MNKSLWQRVQPHAIAIGIFLIISVIYCLPAFKGLSRFSIRQCGMERNGAAIN